MLVLVHLVVNILTGSKPIQTNWWSSVQQNNQKLQVGNAAELRCLYHPKRNSYRSGDASTRVKQTCACCRRCSRLLNLSLSPLVVSLTTVELSLGFWLLGHPRMFCNLIRLSDVYSEWIMCLLMAMYCCWFLFLFYFLVRISEQLWNVFMFHTLKEYAVNIISICSKDRFNTRLMGGPGRLRLVVAVRWW